MGDDLFVTVEEAAKQLNVNPETIRRRIRKGEIKAQLIFGPHGDQYQIPVNELTVQEAQIIPISQLSPNVVNQLTGIMQQVIEAQTEPLRQEIMEAKAETAAVKEKMEKLNDGQKKMERLLLERDEKLMAVIRGIQEQKKKPWWKL